MKPGSEFLLDNGETLPEHPLISVIIPNYNGVHLLPDSLSSLDRQTFRSFEVIVVDNGSSDGSLDFLKKLSNVRTLAMGRNLGFAAGCNAGIREARGEFIALLNSDASAEQDWLARLVAAAQAHPEADSFASTVLRLDNGEIVDSAGDLYSIAGSAKKRGEGRPRSDLPKEPGPVFGAGACAGFYRRRFFEVTGLFDEHFFCYFEDVDLSFRAVLKGLSCLYVPDAVVHHRVSATWGEKSDFVTYHNSRNMEWTFLKNMPGPLMIGFLLPALALRFMALVYWTAQGKGRVFLRAKKDALASLRRILREREEIRRAGMRSPRQVLRLLEHHWVRLHLQGRL